MLRKLICLGVGLLPALLCAEPGVAPRSLLIGQSIALEQGRNPYGVAVARGVGLYIDKVNAEGGVHGRKLVLQTLDDENKADKAEANARKLVADGVFLLFGSIEGGPSTAVAKIAESQKIPFVGPMAGSPTLRRPHLSQVFPVRAEHREEFRALMNWGKRVGLSTVGFMRSDSEVGQAHLENVRLIAAELGMQLVLDLPFKGDVSEAQLTAMVQQIAEKKPGMLFNHGSSGMYVRLIEKARQAGLATQFMGVNSGSTQIAEKLGPLARGMVFSQVVPNPRDRKHPATREFQSVVAKARLGESEFSYGEIEGFLTAKALVAALRQNGPELTRTSLLQTLERMRFDLGGMNVRWAPGDHEGSRFVDLSIVGRDGRFVD